MLNTLPNDPTEHDLTQVLVLIKKGLCKKLYDLSGSEIFVESFCEDTQTISCYVEHFDMFSSIDNCLKKENFTLYLSAVKIENFWAYRSSAYKEFKSCSVAKKLEDETVVISHPESTIGIVYTEGGEAPFQVTIGDEVYHFCAFDSAYRLAFENSNFVTAASKRMDEIMESLLTDEFIETIADEINTSIEEKRDFAESAEFKETLVKCKALLEREDECIAPCDWALIELSSEEQFYTFFDAALTLSELEDVPDTLFRTQCVKHNGMTFTMVHGQGTIYRITLTEKV